MSAHLCRRLAVLVGSLLLLGPVAACTGGDPAEVVGLGDGESSRGQVDPADLLVEAPAGALRGVARDDILSWNGIPYAAPPVDERRWTPPAAPERWEGERDAADYGAACPQAAASPTDDVNDDTSEDCLFLNVNRPEGDVEDLPVMVWLHGGGFVAGEGSDPLSNSPALVERGVVLVSLNYRLGRFGFFAHPTLRGGVANFGILDQVAALRWIRTNISAFGGDPDNVTVFGGSAGGMSVNALMSSPRAQGLFVKAISQSGLGREPSQSLAQARAAGVGMARALGMPGADVDQLRHVDADTLSASWPNVFLGEAPIVDGQVLPAPVSQVFAEGRQAAVPYLLGTTDLEYPGDSVRSQGVDSDQVTRGFLGGDSVAAVRAYGTIDELRLRILSDAIFTEPARNLARRHAARAPTYLYRFSIAPLDDDGAPRGARHGSDILYAFDATEDRPGMIEESPELADTIADYWVAFATTGDPNHDGAPAWPTADDGALMELSNEGPVVMTDDPWGARLDVIERVYDARS